MKEAIQKTTGPCVILAGAGTGKTHAIVEKVVHLIKNHLYLPEEIVCVTFSNEAARSMESRIMNAIHSEQKIALTSRPKVRTFHALCADLLKEHGDRIGLNKDFRIITEDDAMISLHKNLKVPAMLCGTFVSAIGMAKDLGISLQDYESFLVEERKVLPENITQELEQAQFQLRTMHSRRAPRNEKTALTEKIDSLGLFIKRNKLLMTWKAYEKLKQKKNAQDYADLNANALVLLKNHPEIVSWKYLVVDEFQDTNLVQLELIKSFAPHKNVTIVGDLNQSIYRFRGAYKDNMELFSKMFDVQSTDIFNLTHSRRSPNTILRVAHKIIQNNYQNREECFLLKNSDNREGLQVRIFELKNGKEEVRKIMEIIDSKLKEGKKPEDICAMFRTHQQANLLKRSLEQHKIIYHSATKKPLLKHPLVKKTISYLDVANSISKKEGNSLNSWWEIIHASNLPQQDEIIIADFMRKNREDKAITEKILNPETIKLSELGKNIYSSLIDKMKALSKHASKPIPEFVQETYSLLDLPELEKTKEGRESLLALEEFKKMINEQNNKEFFDLSSFLHHLDIIRALQLELEAPAGEERGIKIMTAHSTKGLEYPIVIIANMAQKKFPIERFNTKPLIPPEMMPEIKAQLKSAPVYLRDEIIRDYERQQQLKEERRLCYVACTRAKEELYMTFAQEYGGKPSSPSEFLIEANYKENPDILFEQDLEEKYAEPHEEAKPTINLLEMREKEPSFSPSALKLFVECQKKYEYKYVLNMPEEKPASWEAIKLGSFVHKVIEQGVKENFLHERNFNIYANSESLKPEWEGLDLNEALLLIKVFYERNKNKYDQKSKCEQHLYLTLSNIRFNGIADRIDFHDDGLEIIDYKTGYATIPPQERNWQLGIYALAASKYGPVKRVTLDMLRQERPLEFDLTPEGLAIERNTRRMSFSLEEVKSELVQTAKNILSGYKTGFKPCPIEKNCDFCNERIWKI